MLMVPAASFHTRDSVHLFFFLCHALPESSWLFPQGVLQSAVPLCRLRQDQRRNPFGALLSLHATLMLTQKGGGRMRECLCMHVRVHVRDVCVHSCSHSSRCLAVFLRSRSCTHHERWTKVSVRQRERETDRQTDRQTGRQADRQAGRQTERGTHAHTHAHTPIHTHTPFCSRGASLLPKRCCRRFLRQRRPRHWMRRPQSRTRTRSLLTLCIHLTRHSSC